MNRPHRILLASLGIVALLAAVLGGCTVEQRNRMGRGVINWTGTNGVLDVYAGERLAMRFIGIDKLTTGEATSGSGTNRAYRFGYGTLDKNQNYKADPGEPQLYFEISDFSTNYVFYQNPES
ncbi:MAG: hypothetical protein ACFB21_03225 [Opitutales bacterium]